MTGERPQLWQVINLLQVSVTEVRVRTSLIPEALPASPPQLHLDVQARGKDHSDKNIVEVVVNFCVFATPSGEDQDRPLDIHASYRITYSRPQDFIPTEDELQEFAKNNGVFNAWPYWREFTHSLYGRMNLPFPPLPVFRVGGGIHRQDPPPPQAEAGEK